MLEQCATQNINARRNVMAAAAGLRHSRGPVPDSLTAPLNCAQAIAIRLLTAPVLQSPFGFQFAMLAG